MLMYFFPFFFLFTFVEKTKFFFLVFANEYDRVLGYLTLLILPCLIKWLEVKKPKVCWTWTMYQIFLHCLSNIF